VPGRYGVSARESRRVRRGVRPVVRRITLVGSSTALALGAFAVVDTLPAVNDALIAGSLESGRGFDDDLSRSAVRDAWWRGDSLVEHTSAASVPVTVTADPNTKPPASASLPSDSGNGKRVVFDITAQQVWLVDATNTVARTYKVSGSRYNQLPTGTFSVFSTSRNTTSWHGTETMEYMVRFYRGERSNIGFHDIPVVTATGAEIQSLAELGVPLSDGCIRQDVVDAQALWDFAPVGTPVVVTGS
jgi:lipoprotein-anchoring transpeptidase ErfK/SrfK